MTCGHSLEVPCPNCATELPPGAKFCFNCGFEIEAGATTGEGGKPAQQVTDEITEAVTRLGETSGERRTITMLFCDVTGSTAAAEQLDPEAWTSVMRGAFDAFIAPVERYGGTVARLLGDAILAYFGAPVAHEDDPERAVLAALDILESSESMATRILDEHGVDFGVRIGINTGLVVVGDVGSDLFGEYAALGDAANVAARMEHTAEPNTIRVAEATHRLVGPLFDFEAVGDIEVKGKTDPIAAYRVVGVKKERGELRGIAGLESPMVGREAEAEQALRAFADLRSGRGRILSIMGEAGLGKSRLTAEVKGTIGDEVRWLEGRSFSYDVATPYGPYLTLMGRSLELEDVHESDRYRRIQEKLTDALGSDAGSQAVYLATLLGVDVEGEDAGLLEFLELPVLRERTFNAVAAYLAGLASDQPTVVVLEDLHWADDTSIELTEALMPLTDRAPLLLLLQFRPWRQEPGWRIHEAAGRDYAHRYTAITLQPLDGEASAELVANLLKVEGLSDSVRGLILDKAEGNPFFVEEVIRSLLDEGVIAREDDRFVATAEVDSFAVPDTLAAVLATRLDALPAGERKVVQAAAVIGREFSFDMLDALTDVGVDLDAVVRDLLRRELIVEQPGADGRVYLFKHALTRDTAYGALLQGVRTDLHRLVGKLIEEEDPSRVTELAYHFTEAGEPSLAFPYLVAAGDADLQAFATQSAIAHYRRALESFAAGDDVMIAAKAYEGLAQAYIFGGDVPAALEAYGDMLAFGERVVVQEIQVSALNKRALAYTNIVGDLTAAEADLDLARKTAEACGYQAGIAEFHTVYCSLNTAQGNLDNAEAHLKEAVDLAIEIDSTYTRNFGLAHHAQTVALMGRFAEARQAVEEALPTLEASGDRVHIAEIIGITRATVNANLGDPVAGYEDAAWATKELNEIGAIFIEPITGFVGGLLALQLGRLEDSMAMWERTMELGELFGDQSLISIAAAGSAMVRGFIYGPGDDEVQRLVERSLESLGLQGGESAAHFSLPLLARMALIGGDIESARSAVADAGRLRSPGKLLAQPILQLLEAEIAMADGDLEAAEELIAEAATSESVSNRASVADATGLLHVYRGEFDEAIASFEAAAEQATELGLLALLLGIQGRATMMLGAAGRPEAQRFGEAAGDTVAEIASLIEDAELRKTFLRTNTAR